MAYRELTQQQSALGDSIWSSAWNNNNQVLVAGIEPVINQYDIHSSADSSSVSITGPTAAYGDDSCISCISVLFHPTHSNLFWSSWLDNHLRCYSIKPQANSLSSGKNNALYTINTKIYSNWSLSHHPTQNLLSSGNNKGQIVLYPYDINENSSMDGSEEAKSVNNAVEINYSEGSARLLESDTGKFTYSTEFSSDGHTVASSHADGSVILFDLATGKLRDKINPHSAAVRAIAFNSNNSLIFSGSDDSYVNCYDIRSSASVFHFQAHNSWVTDLQLLNRDNHQQLITASMDKKIKLFDCRNLATHEVIHTFENNNASVWNITLNPQQNLLASGADDGTLKIFQLKQ
jgi:WD40 repeat protein